MDDVYLTRDGFQKLNDELEGLKKNRHKIAKEIDEARQLGDLKENAEYHAAKEAQAHNETRVQELEGQLAGVKIIEDQDIASDKIYIGAIVTLLDLDEDEEITYQFVSPQEASYEENKLSIVAPIGKALLGHAEGEELDIKVPAGVLRYKILKIKRPK